MVMATQQQHDKGSPKQARNEPAPPPQPAPFRFEQCRYCDDAHRQADDGSNGAGPAGPLHLSFDPLGSAAERRRCSCGVAPAPAAPATVAVLRGSRYLRPAQELLGEVVRVADLAAGEDGDEDQAAERLEGGGRHRSVIRAAANDGDGDGVQAKLLGLLTEVRAVVLPCIGCVAASRCFCLLNADWSSRLRRSWRAGGSATSESWGAWCRRSSRRWATARRRRTRP